MPYTPNYAISFVEAYKSIKGEELKKRVNKAIQDILALENPRDMGGEYLGRAWAYPFPVSSALVCEIDDGEKVLTFIDIIKKL